MIWTEYEAKELLQAHTSFAPAADQEAYDIDIMDGDGRTILVVPKMPRPNSLGLTHQEMAEFIAFVLNDYAKR